MRQLIDIVENSHTTPAAGADMTIRNSIDPTWGYVVTNTLSGKSSHPHYFDWPELDDEDSVIILTQIESSKKGKGYGGKMMKVVCDIADKYGCTIILDANSFGNGISQSALKSFYLSFDFEDFETLNGYMNHPMVRYPE